MLQTLLLLPGLLSDGTAWEDAAGMLSDEAAIAVPDYADCDSLAKMAERALAMSAGKMAVAGHSMGARVALEMVARAPERVSRLALFDTGTHPPAPGERDKRQLLVDLAYRDGMAALAAAWLPPMVHPARRADRALMDRLAAMVLRRTPEEHEAQIRALLGRRDAAPLLEAVHCPTLIAVGRQDAWSPPAQHEAMAARLPQARLAVIEDAGHFAPAEQPQAIAALLRDWLSA